MCRKPRAGSASLAPVLPPALLPLRPAGGLGRAVGKTLLARGDVSLDQTGPVHNLK